MLSDKQRNEVNQKLALCEAGNIKDIEATRLDIIKASPNSNCEYYEAAGLVLEMRSATNSNAKGQIKILMQLSTAEGCAIEEPEAKTPEVKVPFFAMGGF